MLFPKYALCSLVLLILHLECDRGLLLALGVPGHGFALCLGHLCHLLLPCGDRDNCMCTPAAPKCFFIPVVSAGMLALLFGVFDGNVLWEELCGVTVCCADLGGQAGMGFFYYFIIIFSICERFLSFLWVFCVWNECPVGGGSMQCRVCTDVCAGVPWHFGLVAVPVAAWAVQCCV